jgi:hypothetical protein
LYLPLGCELDLKGETGSNVVISSRMEWDSTVIAIEIHVRSQGPCNSNAVIPSKTEWDLTTLTIGIHADSRWRCDIAAR